MASKDSSSSPTDSTPSAPSSPVSKTGRRSSLFSTLESLKHGSTHSHTSTGDDGYQIMRRASMHDQRPQGGVFSQMWTKWVRGGGGPGNAGGNK